MSESAQDERPGLLVGAPLVDHAPITVIELHPFSYDCAMCGIECADRFGVPYHCGPVSSSFPTDGGSSVCQGCYEKWVEWDATQTGPAYMPPSSMANPS